MWFYSARAPRMLSSGCWLRSFNVRNTNIDTLCVSTPRSLRLAWPFLQINHRRPNRRLRSQSEWIETLPDSRSSP